MKARRVMATIVALPVFLAVSWRAEAAGQPVTPIGGHLQDRDAAVWAQRDMTISRVTAKHGSPALTSYQPVCVNGSTSADACHRSSSLCPSDDPANPQIAVWVLTAPAGPPAPGPDDWTNTGRIACQNAAQAQAPVVVTAAQFRRLPIPAAQIVIQPNPADRPTLVNVRTNLLTVRTVQLLPTTVLGRAVRVRATPASYHWSYGDGETRTTTEPGHPYPDMPTAHVYRRPGTFTIRLTTTFNGEYSVAGGPWQPIDGTATVTGPAIRLVAIQARTELVS